MRDLSLDCTTVEVLMPAVVVVVVVGEVLMEAGEFRNLPRV